MHIGLDFDNTIVSYDAVFHRAALEKDAIHAALPIDRLAVRDYLRSINQEDIWTHLQGEVYGARMDEAAMYPDILSFISEAQTAGHTLSIVSHKTKYPYLGPLYDLHASALTWIKRHLSLQGRALFKDEHVFFELTKEDKLARIKELGCDIFIDDLPEILLAAQFPDHTRRFLFDPRQHYVDEKLPHIQLISSWAECGRRL